MRGEQLELFAENDINIYYDIERIDVADILNPVLNKKPPIPKNLFTLYRSGHTDHLLPKHVGKFPFIINNVTGNILKASLWGNGANYRYWLLGKLWTPNCHTLVASAFLPNNNPKHKKVVLHLNDKKYDFRVSNLKWGTYRANNSGPKEGEKTRKREEQIIKKGSSE